MTVIDTPNETTAIQRQHDTPMTLIDRAIELKADPAQVEKWMELQERYEKREAEKAYARAMHACQGEMPSVYKEAQNTHTRSKYAKLENVQKTTRPVYSEHGFCLSFGEEPCPTEGYKRTVCDVIHAEGHIRRYHLDLPIDGEGAQGGKSAMNKVQGCISTTSYGQRRLLCMIFNITLTDEDDDGQGANGPTVTEEQAITLQEITSTFDVNTIRRALKWASEMAKREIQSWHDLPASMYDAAKVKLTDKAAEIRKAAK